MVIGIGATLLVLAGAAGGLFLGAQRIAARAEAAAPPIGQFAEAAGGRLHYVDTRPPGWRDGDPTVVFVHGASGNLRDQRLAFEEHVAARGWRRIYVDRPGHGHSARGGADMHRPERQAQAILALLEGLGVRSSVAVGHSWGGSVIAQMALLAPERIAGLVFVAPATHPWPGGVTWYYDAATAPVAGWLFSRLLAPNVATLVAPRAIAAVFSPETPPEGYAQAIGAALLFRPQTFAANAEDVARLKPEVERAAPLYPRITQPAAIVTGDADTVVLPEIHSAGLLRDLPNAWRVDLAGAGHMPHHTRTVEVVAEIERVVGRAFAGRAQPADEAAIRTSAGD